jgi:hypothetical protein
MVCASDREYMGTHQLSVTTVIVTDRQAPVRSYRNCRCNHGVFTDKHVQFNAAHAIHVVFVVALYASSLSTIGAVSTRAVALYPRPTTSPGTINTPVGPFLYIDRTSSSSFASLEQFVSVAGEEPAEEHSCRDSYPHLRHSAGGGHGAAVNPLSSVTKIKYGKSNLAPTPLLVGQSLPAIVLLPCSWSLGLSFYLRFSCFSFDFPPFCRSLSFVSEA